MIFLPLLILLASLAGTSIAGGGHGHHPPAAHQYNAGHGIVPSAKGHIAGNSAVGINGGIQTSKKTGQNAGGFVKKLLVHLLLFTSQPMQLAMADPRFMGNANFGNTHQQQFGGGRKSGGHSSNANGKGKAGPAAAGELKELPQNAWKCESVISEGGNRQYKYIVEVESENKFNLLAKTKEGGEFVNIATVDPKHDNKVDIDPASHGTVSNIVAEEEEDDNGKWTPVLSKRTKKQLRKEQKAMAEREAKTKQLVAKLSPAPEEYLKKLYGQISARLEKQGRRLLQSTQTFPPDSVKEHVLWNDENGQYSILTRIRHILIQTPTASGTPSSYNFSVSFEPYYQPNKIYQFDWVQVTAPSTDNRPSPPVAPKNGSYDIGAAPSPATNDPAGKLPITYMAVCSDTPTRDFSVCSWVDLSADKQHGHFCNGYYYNDGKSTAPDQKNCIEVKACALSGNGC